MATNNEPVTAEVGGKIYTFKPGTSRDEVQAFIEKDRGTKLKPKKTKILDRVGEFAGNVANKASDFAQSAAEIGSNLMDPIEQYGIGAAKSQMDMADFMTNFGSSNKTELDPNLIENKQPKNLIGKTARVLGEYTSPGILGVGTPLLKAAEGSISMLPKVAKYSQVVKNGIETLGSKAYRPIFDFVMKTVNKISPDAAEILYDNPEIVPKLEKKVKVIPKVTELMSEDLGQNINIKDIGRVHVGQNLLAKSNKKQEKAFQYIENNMGDFLSKQKAPQIKDILDRSGIDDSFKEQITKRSADIFNPVYDSKETPAVFADTILKRLIETKVKASDRYKAMIDPLMKNTMERFDVTGTISSFADDLTSKGILQLQEGEVPRSGIGTSLARSIYSSIKKESKMSPREIENVINTIDNKLYESRSQMPGDIQTTLKKFSSDLKTILRSSYKEYEAASSEYSSAKRSIERILGENMADELPSKFDINNPKNTAAISGLRNKLMSLSGNAGEKISEDIIGGGTAAQIDLLNTSDSMATTMPDIADRLRDYVINKSTKKDISRVLNSVKMDLSSFGSLTDKLGSTEKSFANSRELLNSIDNFLPEDQKYLGTAKAALSWGEIKPLLRTRMIELLTIGGISTLGGMAPPSTIAGAGFALSGFSPKIQTGIRLIGKEFVEKGMSPNKKKLIKKGGLNLGKNITAKLGSNNEYGEPVFNDTYN